MSILKCMILVIHVVSSEKIAHIKTHKTGSTTLMSILFRRGARQGTRFYCQRDPHTSMCSELVDTNVVAPPADFQVNHVTKNGSWDRDPQTLIAWYQNVLESKELIIVPVREPVQRCLSWYYFFNEPHTNETFEELLETNRLCPPLVAEFGIRDESQARALAADIAWGPSPAFGGSFQAWIPLDYFDEALILLARTRGWSLLDITYVKLFDSHVPNRGLRSGKRLLPTPKLSEVSHQVREKIRAMVEIDYILYDAAVAAFMAELEKVRTTEDWKKDVQEFSRLQSAVRRSKRVCRDMNRWYGTSMIGYEPHRMLASTGRAQLPPTMSESYMMESYKKSQGRYMCATR